MEWLLLLLLLDSGKNGDGDGCAGGCATLFIIALILWLFFG